MTNCCRRFRSELKTPMFEVEDASRGKLDLKESFQMDKGLCSRVGIAKLLMLLVTWAIFVHAVATHPEPLFYPAFLTAWGILFAIFYQTASLLLTATSCCSPTKVPDSRLIKFTWIFYSISTVMGCIICTVFWAGRHAADQTRPVILVDVTVHGVVLLTIVIQGLLVDRVPFRIKHSLVTGIFGLLYLVWLLLQNLVIRYNPIDEGAEDEDDAIYNTLNFREDVQEAIGNTVIIVFGFFPFYTILFWALSLRGRKYLSDGKDEKSNGDNSQNTQETHEFDHSNNEIVEDDSETYGEV